MSYTSVSTSFALLFAELVIRFAAPVALSVHGLEQKS
jgi:hypothetical protein